VTEAAVRPLKVAVARTSFDEMEDTINELETGDDIEAVDDARGTVVKAIVFVGALELDVVVVSGQAERSQASTEQHPVNPFVLQTYQLAPIGQSPVTRSLMYIFIVVDARLHRGGKI
jgi:hypothetical protein